MMHSSNTAVTNTLLGATLLVLLVLGGAMGDAAAGTCLYDNAAYKPGLGFNPFERWAGYGLSSALFRAVVEGRFCAGYVYSEDSSYNTQPTSFRPATDSPWALTVAAGANNQFYGINVINGGAWLGGNLEADSSSLEVDGDLRIVGPSSMVGAILKITGAIKVHDASPVLTDATWTSTPVIPTVDPTLTPPFPQAGDDSSATVLAYYNALSIKLAGMPDSNVYVHASTDGKEIVMGLHGRGINIVNTLTLAQVQAADTLVLKGHPMGMVVINLVVPPNSDARLDELNVVYESDGKRCALAFGRVMLNFLNNNSGKIYVGPTGIAFTFNSKRATVAQSLFAGQDKKSLPAAAAMQRAEAQTRRTGRVANAAPPMELNLSILAPTFTIIVKSTILTGNLIASIPSLVDTTLKTQPFGTTPRRTQTGNGGTGQWKCVWGTL